jgi:hypothetical protein
VIHFFIFLFSFAASAEYRAYQLAVVNSQTKASRLVEPTTIDHLQYYTYYNVRQIEYVQLVSTWMCPGRTDNFEPICANPKGKPEASRPTEPATTVQSTTLGLAPQPQLTSTSP